MTRNPTAYWGPSFRARARRFTQAIEDKLFVNLEEVQVDSGKGGKSVGNEANRLRDMITNNQRSVRRMFQNPGVGRNLTNFMSTSNLVGNDDIVTVGAGKDARRFFALHVNGKPVMLLPMFVAWYPNMEPSARQKAFLGQVANDYLQPNSVHLKTFANYLYNVDITGFVPKPPITRTLIDQKVASLPTVARMYHDRLVRGYNCIKQTSITSFRNVIQPLVAPPNAALQNPSLLRRSDASDVQQTPPNSSNSNSAGAPAAAVGGAAAVAASPLKEHVWVIDMPVSALARCAGERHLLLFLLLLLLFAAIPFRMPTCIRKIAC